MQRRILIFANVFDRTHDLMGFLPSWVEAFRREGASVRVLAQDVHGDADATVIDLMKRRHPGRIGRALRVIGWLWRLRDSYDSVLVVMAPGWAFVIGLVARALGKRVYLWYAVWRGTWKLRLAERVVNAIFCSVPESFPWVSRKVRAVGQAIDVEQFKPGSAPRIDGQIAYVGRISPVKRLEVLIDALGRLPDVPDAGSVVIAGAPLSDSDRAYATTLRTRVDHGGLGRAVVWLGAVGHHEVQELYQRSDIVVNMTPAGSFDKVMLEAMACGAIVIASNPALRQFLPGDLARLLVFREGDADDCARALIEVVAQSIEEKQRIRSVLRSVVEQHHSLTRWAHTILNEMA